jgi:hypothetical protein
MFEMQEQKIFKDGVTWYQTVKLPESVVNYLWGIIEVAKVVKIDERRKLAGNISSSLKLEDKENIILTKIFPKLYESNEKNIKKLIDKTFSLFSVKNKNINLKVVLSDLWVNFQKKYEFNPIHSHEGILSFVIWMDIPYSWEDEQNLEFAKHSNLTNVIGNFVFYHYNGNEITNQVIPMSPEINGTMAIFPSCLNHCVYPFYTSDKERITISGNIVFNLIDE